VNERLGVQLIGDSFAEQYVAAFDPAAKRLGVRGEAYTAEGCPMLVGLVRTQFDGSAKCRQAPAMRATKPGHRGSGSESAPAASTVFEWPTTSGVFCVIQTYAWS
jgi:hypothetical protein